MTEKMQYLALVVAELPYQAVGRDPVSLSPCVATFDVCGAGRLVLPPQDNVGSLFQTASEYYRYYMSFSVLFYMFYSLEYKYSIGTYLLVILNILPIIHTHLINLCNVILNSTYIYDLLILHKSLHTWIFNSTHYSSTHSF
jgi:hypothetical protein